MIVGLFIPHFDGFWHLLSRVYIVMHQKQKENLRKFYKGKLSSIIKMSAQVSRQDDCLKSWYCALSILHLTMSLPRKEVQAPGPPPQEDQGHQEGSLSSWEVPEDCQDSSQDALFPWEEVRHQSLNLFRFDCPTIKILKISDVWISKAIGRMILNWNFFVRSLHLLNL